MRILSPLLVVACVCAGGVTARAQSPQKIDLYLNAWLDRDHPPGAMLDLFVHGPAAEVARAVEDEDGLVKMALPRIVSARVPVDRVRTLAQHPAVERFECALDPAMVMNDSMRVRTFIEPAHQGMAPLPQGYDGEGVIMGIIDSGLDYNHPDFQNADGTTRILKYWDQTLVVGPLTPAEFGYGQVWDSGHIDNGEMTSVDQVGYWGHGSTVTGTAAGNGLANGRHKGGAPGADLIIVSASFSGNFRAKVADAVKFIFDEAAALGRPAVVNASLGTYLGSHDGQDAAALLIDDLLHQSGGRMMVCAMGNSNNWAPYHLRTEVGSDTTFTWFRNNNNSGLGFPAVFFEVWADQPDLIDVQYAMGADRVTPSIQYRGQTPFRTLGQALNSVVVDTLWSLSGHRLGVVQYYAVQRGEQYLLQVLMQQPDSAGYNFRFMTKGQGKFDVWSTSVLGTSNMVTAIPSVGVYPDIAHYVLPDNNKHMVDSWACSPHVLAVANYYNLQEYVDCNGNTVLMGGGAEGDISLNSSKGPTRDDRQKPDVAATGDVTMSSPPLGFLNTLIATEPHKVAEGCMHIRGGGTSIASPVVAATAALYLQKCPNAAHQEVIAAINGTAFSDAFTGATPNNHFGHGKLDAFSALVSSNLPPITLELLGPSELCDGEVTQVLASGDLAQYLWNNGAEVNPVTVGESIELTVIGLDPSGCKTTSVDTVQIVVHLLPPTPEVAVNGVELTSSAAGEYQWFHNGAPIPGAVGQVYMAGTGGEYAVMITDENGCMAMSDVVLILITGMEGSMAQAFAVWPSPASDLLTVRLPDSVKGSIEVLLLDARGSVVQQSLHTGRTMVELTLHGLAAGVYTVQVRQGEVRWSQRFVKRP